MDDHLASLTAYIQQQLQTGHRPDDIAAGLRAAQWPDDSIQRGFYAAQAAMLPSDFVPATSPATVAMAPQPTQQRRGRVRTGWLLFKQCVSLLRTNRYLLRYLIMTWVWVLGITAVLVAVHYYFDGSLYRSTDSGDSLLTPLGYLLALVDWVLITFVINLYAASLTANVFDLFDGKREPYRVYMQRARAKAPAIFTFSLISATVGFVLRYVVERVRWVGWLLSWFLGTLWSLGTLFAIPIIMSNERPSGIAAIKQSVRFFKQTWGEGIVAKASVNVPVFFLQCGLLVVAFISFIGAATAAGLLGMVIVLFLYLTASLTLVVIGSFANSITNIALFYFATTQRVPPAFSAELLNQVFVQKRRRGKAAKLAAPATA
jgi:hypothetical protein